MAPIPSPTPLTTLPTASKGALTTLAMPFPRSEKNPILLSSLLAAGSDGSIRASAETLRNLGGPITRLPVSCIPLPKCTRLARDDVGDGDREQGALRQSDQRQGRHRARQGARLRSLRQHQQEPRAAFDRRRALHGDGAPAGRAAVVGRDPGVALVRW